MMAGLGSRDITRFKLFWTMRGILFFRYFLYDLLLKNFLIFLVFGRDEPSSAKAVDRHLFLTMTSSYLISFSVDLDLVKCTV